MSIKKIVSGGQTGADRAALDFAIEYYVEHGGWVPEGRKAEDGMVPMRYNMTELPGGDYADRTVKNILDSDGTLIVSRGGLNGGSLLTRVMAEKHLKPVLHVDMRKMIIFDAAIDAHDWIEANDISVLNVAGPRESKDPDIYKITRNVLETLFHVEIIASTMPGMVARTPGGIDPLDNGKVLPGTVGQAVDHLILHLSSMEKMRIASSDKEDLRNFAGTLIAQLGLDSGNQALIDDCRKIAGSEDASMVILMSVWEKLRDSGHLRIVR